MPSKITNKEVEDCLRELLAMEGFDLNRPKSYGQNGVDILAVKGGESAHIEVIGYKSSGPSRARDFFEAFFRTVSRLEEGATKCVIALPHLAQLGLPARASQYKSAWERIGNAFPELEIWLVDTGMKTYQKTNWSKWTAR